MSLSTKALTFNFGNEKVRQNGGDGERKVGIAILRISSVRCRSKA